MFIHQVIYNFQTISPILIINQLEISDTQVSILVATGEGFFAHGCRAFSTGAKYAATKKPLAHLTETRVQGKYFCGLDFNQ